MDFVDPQRLAGFTILGGTLDGRTTLNVNHRFNSFGDEGVGLLRALPFVSEARGTRVAYGFFDGRISLLSIVSLDSGAITQVDTRPEVIHSAAVAPNGSVYYMILDPITREERGILRRRLGEAPVQFMGPRGLEPPAIDGSSLFVTPNGEFLLVQDCGTDSCVLRAYDGESGELRMEQATSHRRVLGVFDDHIVVADDCVEPPCGALRVALQQDEIAPFGVACDRAQAIVIGTETAVATSGRRDCAGDALDLVASSVSGGRWMLGRPEFAGMHLVELSTFDALDLPDGSIVVTEGGALRGQTLGFILDVSSGQSYPFDIE